MLRVIFSALGFIFILFFNACTKPIPRNTIDLYLEAPTRSASFGLHQAIKMPVSGVEARITAPAVANIDAFTNSELVVQEFPELDLSVPGIRLRIDSKAWLKIYQATEDARVSSGKDGSMKRLFLIVNGQVIGYCPLRRQLRQNDLFFIIESNKSGIELSDELKELNFMLNEYILSYREYKHQQREK